MPTKQEFLFAPLTAEKVLFLSLIRSKPYFYAQIVIKKSVKVNLFVEKLSETEIKVEYRVLCFSSIVL